MSSRKKIPAKLPKLSRIATLAERLAEGKELRTRVPRQNHAPWKAPVHRRNPVDLLVESSVGRIPELLPIRYGRMVQSPFTFYRGAAAIMAADLAKTPRTGIFVQACGDCHLLNFGGFATPERRLIFDINDFDETLPGPWEWDLKRLVTSFVIASQHSGFSKAETREAALACVRSYRKRLAEYSEMRVLDVWYASIEFKSILADVDDKTERSRVTRRVNKIVSRNVVEDDFPKLVESSGQEPRIRDHPPLIYHPPEAKEKDFDDNVREAYLLYRESLPHDRRQLLDRYQVVDIAMKVVGVGSVGTWCGIVLHMAGDKDPLFLQVKEARASVLEPYLGKTPYPNHGQRVVVGQRLMQSASDIFLGWGKGTKKGRHFYVRQLRDAKITPRVEIFSPTTMRYYAKICGWALARAHAKSGDAGRISGYLGKSDRMDEALADFGEAYAKQNEMDHQALVEAVRKGKIEVYMER